MEKELWQSGQPVLTNDLLNAQADLEDALTKRFTDSFSSGILEATLGSFAITINVGNTSLIDVATGVAYDVLGNRIAINSPSDVYASFYQTGDLETSGIPFVNGVPNGPLTTTNNGIGGFTLTPQNSGSKGITLFSGDVNSTPYNYIWIGYLQTTDPSVFVLQDLTNLRLFTSANDGYQIVVVGSTSAPTSINPSTLNPDQTNFSFIYLGCVYNPIHTTPLAIGNINTNNRTFYSLENNRLLAVVPSTDSGRTPFYTYGQSVDLQDHVGALGHGVVTPENPHGMNLADLSGVGLTASELLQLTFSSGIAGTNTSSLTGSVGGSIPGTPPTGTWNVNDFVVGPLISGQPLAVNGVIMDTTTALGFVTKFYMATSAIAVLPTDTYTVYIDSASQIMKLAAAGPGVGVSYQKLVNSILTTDVPAATSSLDVTDFPLWSFAFNHSTGVISSVVDLRIFGNIGSANLASDSATNTVNINHNLNITGVLTTASTFTAPIINATTVEEGGFALVPAGALSAFAGSVAPGGWLVCDGTSYATAVHPGLFTAIGYTWGGIGANFNVPDLRGVFLRGANNMGTGVTADAFADPDASTRVTRLSGGETGDNIGSFQEDITVAHTHQYNESQYSAAFSATGSQGVDVSSASAATTGQSPAGGNETRPKNAYVMYIIKY